MDLRGPGGGYRECDGELTWAEIVEEGIGKTDFHPGIELKISDLNDSALTTEPELPDKSQPSHYTAK